ncbi:phosphoribosyltransferase family protein [Chlorobium sp.]|uniref:ComF family protein n=1 Tax=Chlorobium sp. TaxID=1095 RepID=UPI0025BAF55C|nr:phosphoribosyltransferase family protein [Chlorobium sp.]
MMSAQLFHFLFPEVCIVCGQLLMPGEQGCCSGCKENFDAFPDSRAASHALMHSIQSHFSKGYGLFSQVACRYRYYRHRPLQKVLHAMKYEGMYTLGLAFGRELGAWIRDVIPPESIDCLVPVPLHRLKLVERSFNQAEKIAEGIAEIYMKPVRGDLLERCRYTLTQTGLPVAARRKNLDDAFRTSAESIPERILLVDDVVTTGATVVAAAETLKRAGAISITAAAIALTAKE